MSEDHQLLAGYVQTNSREALDALIRRHLPLVYSAARRQVRDPHLAEDVTQAVFLVLAQKARTIRAGTAIGGWLLAVTRHASLNALKQQAIQKRHETMAGTAKITESSGAESKETDAREWEPIAAHLDAELNCLPPKDRDAIVLRFFENRSFSQIGATLAVTDDTAQKRVARALDKLRHLLTRRGITLSAAGLAAALATRAVEAAPTHLIASTLAATTGTSTAATAAIAKGTITVMTWINLKFATGIVFAALLLTGATVEVAHTAFAAPPAQPAAPARQPKSAPPNAPDFAGRPFDVQWTFPGPGTDAVTSRLTDPVVSKNMLYFADETGTVRALNAKDGAPVWRTDYPSLVQKLAVDERWLYISSNKGVAALDSANGTVGWEVAISGGAASNEIALWPATESLFVVGDDGLTYALDRRTGKAKWTHDLTQDAPPDAPNFDGSSARLNLKARPQGIATDGKNVYQSVFDQSRVVALDGATGRQRWSFQARGWILGSAALDDKHVFIGSQDDHFYCLNKDDGKPVWDFATGSRIEASPTIAGKNVCIASCDGILYCADIATGKIVWKFQTAPDPSRPRSGGPIYSKPVIIGDALYFAAGEGQVYALATDSGKLLWQTRPAPGSELYTNPATDGERIFLTSRSTPAPQKGRVAPNEILPPPTGAGSIIALLKSSASAAPP